MDLTPLSFKAVTRCIGNSIIEDLGDPEKEGLVVSGATSDGNVSVQAGHPIPRETEHADAFPSANPLAFPLESWSLDHVEEIRDNTTA
jgi:hypothetical protein